MKTSRRMKLALFALITMVILLAGANFAGAHFAGPSWDYPGHKRNLKVKIPNTEPWQGWARDAIANWNDASATTGWSLTEDAANPDVEIKTADLPAAERNGGGVTEIAYDPLTGESTSVTITMDTDVRDEAVWGARKPSGGDNGWGTAGATTLDPILVLKHELGHVLRLTHGKGVDTGNLEEPITPGNHNNPADRKPSASDKTEAKKGADDTAPTVTPAPIGPAGGSHYNSGTTVEIDSGTLSGTYNFWIMKLSRLITPNITSIDSPGVQTRRGIVYAVDLSTDYSGNFTPPVKVTMQYTDADIDGGYAIGEQHGDILPPLDEDSLKVYGYDELSGVWTTVPDSALDKNNNTLTFDAGHFSIYGIGGEPAPTGSDTFRGTIGGFLAIAAGTLLMTLRRRRRVVSAG